MAKERGFKLVSLTKSACPAVDAKRPDQGAFKMVHCTKAVVPSHDILSSPHIWIWRKREVQFHDGIHQLGHDDSALLEGYQTLVWTAKDVLRNE